MPGTNKRLRRGFTLIELLVVVAILTILMGLTIPMYSKYRERGKYVKAKATVKQLELAFNEYCNQMNEWPESDNGEKELKGDVIKPLVTNTKNIVFFDFGITNNDFNQFKDPWEHYYKVKFDHDFNNSIEHSGSTLRKSVIVYTSNSTGDRINSWD